LQLLGNDFTKMSSATLGVVSNADAISVSQDDLGIAGRRVASIAPNNLTLVDSGDDVLALLAPCDASKKTQRWTYTTKDLPPVPNLLGIAPCNASDRCGFHRPFSVVPLLKPPCHQAAALECQFARRSPDSLDAAPVAGNRAVRRLQQGQ